VATFRDYTDPHLSIYTRVPAVGPGVCDICHGAPSPGFDRCWSCSQTMRQVTRPLSLIVPISLYQTPGQLWKVLRDYKDGRTPGLRRRFALQVAATLGRFLSSHWRCIAGQRGDPGDQWDLIVTVPSSSGRVGMHPLRQALQLLPPPYGDRETDMLRPGTVTVRHNQADDDGFAVRGSPGGSRILLVDDTYTTGARLQSAASALRRAGGEVVAAVVVGRVIRVDNGAATRALWDAAKAARFSFETCCLERRVTAEPPFDLDAR
jgi:predicted amidophosphoribosyltransferase